VVRAAWHACIDCRRASYAHRQRDSQITAGSGSRDRDRADAARVLVGLQARQVGASRLLKEARIGTGCAIAAGANIVLYAKQAYMIDVRQTDVFVTWFARVRDRDARFRVMARIRRLSLGNPGDMKPVGEGVSEMRVDYGPGYRVYFVRRGASIVVLLCGGDKRTQDRDIARAIDLAREL
jgi:putative addiction module killer protein